MGRLGLILFILLNSLFAHSYPILSSIGFDEVITNFNQNQIQHQQVPVAILDSSFFGLKTLISEHLSDDIMIPESKIASPHGTSVTQVMFNSLKKLNAPILKIGYLGILTIHGVDSLKEHLQNIYEQGIRLVNISMDIQTLEQIELLNKYINKGLVIVVAAGNSAERSGVDMPERYKNFKGLLASSMNENFELTSFSRYCSTCIMVPGDIGQYKTEYIHHYRFDKRLGEPGLKDLQSGLVKKIPYKFGKTSSAAPVLAASIAFALSVHPDIPSATLKKLLLESSNNNGKEQNILNVNHFLNQLID